MCLPGLLFAQKDKKELEAKKKKLQQEMANLSKMLDETTNNKEISLNQLITINKKINVREEIIATINKEVELLQEQINDGNDSIGSLETHLDELKKEYASMVYDAYKNETSYSKLMFIFAADDFQQAVLRMKYLQIYEEYRHKQAILIDSTKKDLNVKVQHLQKKKDEKKELLGSQQDEKEKLANEKTDQQKVLNELQGKEKNLREEIADKQKAAKKLDEAIHKIIEEEIKKSTAKTSTKNAKNVEISLTPEAKALSKDFEGNKGSLPWPVVEGVIFKQFGTYSPLPGISETNNGVDIATTKGAVIRSVFEGEVSGIVDMPSYGKVVLVRHGEYLSVYANLKDVFVKKGDKLTTKQNVGTLQFNEEEGKALLHFEIWKGQNKVDPEDWLYSKN
jgi:septal ring factor EnvC (AmiA/AmiB activator)